MASYPAEAELFLEPEEQLAAPARRRSTDQRVELWLGALVVGFVGLLLAIVVLVFVRAWPSFAHNGLSWFGSGGYAAPQPVRYVPRGYRAY